MMTIRSLFLGSAAGLLAISGAHAADLAVKAKAIEYVKACSLYGAGFWYIPGTDTCIKLGGYMRIDTTFNGGLYDQPAWNGDLGQNNRYRDSFDARSRMALTVDTRTASEYGIVRTFVQADMQFSTLANNTFNPVNLNTSLSNAPQLLDTPGGGYVAVEYAFLQFAGFTFGKSSSAYATPWNDFPGNNSSSLLGGHDTATGVNNIQYTAQFGSGVSGTIGLDDPAVYNRTAVYDIGANAGAISNLGVSSNFYAGVQVPDVVGNIRVDQEWGLFQISAAAHEVDGSYNVAASNATSTALSEISGHPGSRWGGSVMAGLNIKNLPTGTGDDIKLDASWTRGDTRNVIATAATSPSFAMFGGSGVAYQSVGFGATTDGIYAPGGAIQLTEAYGVRGAFNHNWDPKWSSSLFGSYTSVRYDGAAKAIYCASYGAGVAGQGISYSCNPDFNVSQLGVVTRWTPLKNLTFSAEAMWFHLDQGFAGTATFAPTAPKPAATYQYKDQDTVSFNIRAQRNF